ncbi:unnamed protein product, partial [Staurois parvus]
SPPGYLALTIVTPSSVAYLIAGYPLFNSSTLLTVPYLPPLSANPSTGLHSMTSIPLCQSLHSVSSIPLCQSLHWPPLSVLHPSLPIPPLASTQCPPSLSANPSTGLNSVSSIPLCQSLHWLPI